MYSTSSGGPRSLSCLAFMTSRQVMISRPSRIAVISASLTRSLIVAPVAYGVIVASLSSSSSGDLVGHLVQVALVGADPAGLARVADPVDPVDAARPQQRLVQRLGHVRRHHDENPVLGRRLGPHAQGAPAPAVEDAAGLLQAGQLGEQRLQRAHAATAAVHRAAHDEAAAAAVRRCRRSPPDGHRLAGQQRPGVLREVGEPVAARVRSERVRQGASRASRPVTVWPSEPRLPSASASSKNTITPP